MGHDDSHTQAEAVVGEGNEDEQDHGGSQQAADADDEAQEVQHQGNISAKEWKLMNIPQQWRPTPFIKVQLHAYIALVFGSMCHY